MKKTYKLDKDTPEKTFAIFDYMGWDIEEMINEIAKENTYTVIVPRREDDLRTIQIINGGKLTHWSAKDEKLMQTLMVKESPGKWEIVNGVNTKVVVSKNMFSDELKELIAKKENVFEDLAKKELEIISKKNPPVKEVKQIIQ